MKLLTHTVTKLFGSSCPLEKASVVIIPVPWEVTVSSRSGTALGPEGILKASYALKNQAYPPHDLGATMLPIPYDWKALSDTLRHHTVGFIHAIEAGFEKSSLKGSIVKKIDHYAYRLKEDVRGKARSYLQEDKLVGVLGGDHSVPLGLIEALADYHNNFGILQIDAHPGLHKSYQGFRYSHASIMYNVLQMPHIIKLVQVGLRHCTMAEKQVMDSEEGRIVPFFDQDLKNQHFQGIPWAETCNRIIETLPDRVYISVDIDGLDASLCPSTGTPIPGGLSFHEMCYLFTQVAKSGKKVVGFDLCEVTPGENVGWDAQVGSRVLYQLVMLGASQTK